MGGHCLSVVELLVTNGSRHRKDYTGKTLSVSTDHVYRRYAYPLYGLSLLSFELTKPTGKASST